MEITVLICHAPIFLQPLLRTLASTQVELYEDKSTSSEHHPLSQQTLLSIAVTLVRTGADVYNLASDEEFHGAIVFKSADAQNNLHVLLIGIKPERSVLLAYVPVGLWFNEMRE